MSESKPVSRLTQEWDYANLKVFLERIISWEEVKRWILIKNGGSRRV
jgi:hypothetical protein